MTPTGTGRKPRVERVDARAARKRFSELMHRAHFRGERFIITRYGEDFVEMVGVHPDATAGEPSQANQG